MYAVGVYRRCSGQLQELWLCRMRPFSLTVKRRGITSKRYGKPVAFYSDKHGIFRVNQEANHWLRQAALTQLAAMQELDIQIICGQFSAGQRAVERANQTLQDRLVKELRLRVSQTCRAPMPSCLNFWRISTAVCRPAAQ